MAQAPKAVRWPAACAQVVTAALPSIVKNMAEQSDIIGRVRTLHRPRRAPTVQ